MDYEPLKELPGAQNLFSTLRPDAKPGSGSTYAHFEDQTTQRNRSGENHVDKTVGMQQRSTKTVYMKPESVRAIMSWLQDESVSTRLDPVLDDKGKQIGRARVVAVEPFTRKQDKVVGGKYIETGPPKTYSAGQVLAEVPYEQKPVKNLYPVEIFRSDSPKGVKSSNYGIHYGSKITEVLERTKDKIASRGVGGGGGLFPTERGLPGGKRPLKMAQGGLVDKALERNTKYI
jgi:hypothetical protein